jgi:hypothetical protein
MGKMRLFLIDSDLLYRGALAGLTVSKTLRKCTVVILDERFIQVSNLMSGEPLVKVYVII